MKKVFLISMFDKRTNEYKGNLNVAFETSELAKEYLNFQLESKFARFVIVKVDFYTSPSK